MKAKSFALITQLSAIGADFESQESQSVEDKAFAYTHLGHTVGQVIVDLSGFAM